MQVRARSAGGSIAVPILLGYLESGRVLLVARSGTRSSIALDLEFPGIRGPDLLEHAVGVCLGVRLAACGVGTATGDAVVVVAELVRQDVQQLVGASLRLGPTQLHVREAARSPPP